MKCIRKNCKNKAKHPNRMLAQEKVYVCSKHIDTWDSQIGFRLPG